MKSKIALFILTLSVLMVLVPKQARSSEQGSYILEIPQVAALIKAHRKLSRESRGVLSYYGEEVESNVTQRLKKAKDKEGGGEIAALVLRKKYLAGYAEKIESLRKARRLLASLPVSKDLKQIVRRKALFQDILSKEDSLRTAMNTVEYADTFEGKNSPGLSEQMKEHMATEIEPENSWSIIIGSEMALIEGILQVEAALNPDNKEAPLPVQPAPELLLIPETPLGSTSAQGNPVVVDN